MRLSQEQKDLIASLSTNYTTGRPQSNGSDTRDIHQNLTGQQQHELNIIKAPLNCPKWACIILPCINHIPSMKLFKSIVPREAEVRIGSRWIFYDAISLCKGDIVRLTEGDIVPADLKLLSLGAEFADEDDSDLKGSGASASCTFATTELIVDSSQINGLDKPQIITLNSDNTVDAVELYAGSVVLQGEAIAVVTKIGNDVLLSRLIKDGKWPPRTKSGWQVVHQEDCEEEDTENDSPKDITSSDMRSTRVPKHPEIV